MKAKYRLLPLALAALLSDSTVLAREGPGQYPNGSENFMAGALPPPGNYFINYLGYYEGDYRDNAGNKVPGLEVNATFDALRFIHVSGYKILGGDWAVHAIVPLAYQRMKTPFPGIGSGSTFGFGDIVIDPLIIGWHFPPDWHLTVGLDIYLPTGKYNANNPTETLGANYFSFEPIFAFTYLNQSGFEVSAKLMYNIKAENRDTNYQSGDDFHMDYLVGQHFGPWGIGLAGYYLTQTTDDKRNGQNVGNRTRVFAYGPALQYNYQGMSFVASWNHETGVDNGFQGNKFFFKFVTGF
ncbi:transporter [Accumulibacter sp.]|uniref:SphA family protein n=1 Tax=Accumulibacter sp. TaxID=2053492 RepID=UPI0025DA5C90|nr:transporter [Accumulibacter sp.]MCM8595021.1 transporter [Accumulibacter sp.]MCM8625404.1 transporter [Accumulibacter sp.]MDS4049167.1 transporter [Accumulibacter sp.]